jgi:hypothetical protein
MEHCGFCLTDEVVPADPAVSSDAAHINILEFVAIVLNVCGSSLTEGMYQEISVNSLLPFVSKTKQVLSWMRVACRTRRPAVRHFARALAGLLTHHLRLTEATLVGYLRDAHTWLESAIRIPVPKRVTIMEEETHPLLSQTLDASRAWR